ncbi:MAG: efflux RND transporter periplasmic adaptor subunit [Myxococcota bacterium]
MNLSTLLWRRLFLIFVVISVWTGLAGCGDEREAADRASGPEHRSEAAGGKHGPEEDAHAERVVRLDPPDLKEFGIEVSTAEPGWIDKRISLPAEVHPNQDHLAHIAPRFPGIAKEVRAKIGDTVKSGQVLAVVESEALAPYSLKTLIDGVVIAKHITRGEPVSREQAAFVVADLRDVWVDVSVYQKDLPPVRIGQPVIVSAGHGLKEARGLISYISPVVNEDTRTATARVVLPNPDGFWRPGLFVTARIQVERTEVPLAVPRTALVVLEDRTVVFAEHDDGFEPRPVKLGMKDDLNVEIQEGLAPGDRYVSRGGFTLKSELLRGQFAGGHAH